MSSGFKNFKEVFGERKLEDNWRRSKKQIVIETKEEADDDDETAKVDEVEKLSPEDSLKLVRQRYKDNLPITEEAKNNCMDSIVDAYYDLGLVYKEKLKDLKKAADTYEELNVKYPANKFKVTAYYQLFRIYLAMQNQTQADKYKDLILTKYPDSEYAKLISNPDFFAQLAKSKKESDEFYSESFRMYQAGLYQQVIERCRTAPLKFVDSELLPKFAYLKALALGKQKDVAAFRTALQDVVSLFPGDTLRVQAKALLEVLDRAQGIVPENKDTAVVEAEQIFTYVSDTTHYFGIWIKDKKLNTNNLKIALSDFNNSYYSLLKLQVGTNFVDPVNQLIVIREFPNANKATEYLNTLSGTADVTDFIKYDKMDLLLISARNFNKIMKEKNTEEYFKYYKKVYQ
jgi:outer membrane protein assembly factor BamD (BamD/ComL family)